MFVALLGRIGRGAHAIDAELFRQAPHQRIQHGYGSFAESDDLDLLDAGKRVLDRRQRGGRPATKNAGLELEMAVHCFSNVAGAQR